MLLVLVISAGILNYADRQIIALLKPMLEAELGWNDADYAHMVAVFQLAAVIAFLFAGRLVDRIGFRWANPLGVGLWSLAAMAHAFAATIPQFLLARISLGATEAMGTPTAIKTIAHVFDGAGRSMALGAMSAAGGLGAILIPLGIPWLATAVGWRSTFLLVGGAGLLWVQAWFLLTREVDWCPREVPRPGATTVASPWREALRDRRTWAIAGAKALSDQVWWFLLFWAPDLLQRLFHLDMHAIAVPLAIIYLAAAAGSLLGAFGFRALIRRNMSANRARKLVFLICGLCVVPVPLVLQAGSVWLAVLLLGTTLAAHQGFSINLFAVIADIVPPSRVGLVTGLGAFSGNLAGMCILQATGWVLAGGGSYLPMLLLAAVSYLLALLWLHLLVPVLPSGEASG